MEQSLKSGTDIGDRKCEARLDSLYAMTIGISKRSINSKSRVLVEIAK